MSERTKLAASTAAWVASEKLADFLVSLEEAEHTLSQAHRQEVIQLALRAFFGFEQAVEQSLSMEEVLRSLRNAEAAA